MAQLSGYEQEQSFLYESYAPHDDIVKAILYSIHFLAATNLAEIVAMHESGDLKSGYGYTPNQLDAIDKALKGCQPHNMFYYLTPHSKKLAVLASRTAELNPDSNIATAKLPLTSMSIADQQLKMDVAATSYEGEIKFRLPVKHASSTKLNKIHWGAGRHELQGFLKTEVYHMIVDLAPCFVTQTAIVLDRESQNHVDRVISRVPKNQTSIMPGFIEQGRQRRSGSHLDVADQGDNPNQNSD
ncbi:hypothetical protein KBD69_03405 [Candidatus Woesebacteria bacterium]|nr:hypothetical protein [Candidatus Woesebacteria bacterium]